MIKVWKTVMVGLGCAAGLLVCPPTYGRADAVAGPPKAVVVAPVVAGVAANAGAAPPAVVVGANAAVAAPAAAPANAAATTLADCDRGVADEPLIGPGKLTVRVPESYYRQVQASGAQPLRLWVDGVDVTAGAYVYAFPPPPPPAAEPRCATFEYQFHPEASTGQLWAKMYREHWLTDHATLRIRLVPSNFGDKSPDYSVVRRGAITTMRYLGTAVVMMLAVLGSFLWLLFRSDTFRDAAPAWLTLAALNRADYLKASATSPEAAAAVLSKVLGQDGPYLAANASMYLAMADSMRRPRGAPTDLGDRKIAVGLLLQMDNANGRKKLPQVTYSLSRVQTGVWFTFTLAAAMFLAVVFWQLPPISGSLLAILGITVATGAVSLKLDQQGADATGTASDGLLNDLVTGRDDRTHVYRYQSVAVNLILVCYGIGSVYNELQLPTFDPTWLAFLGLSSTFSQLGKQSSEADAPSK